MKIEWKWNKFRMSTRRVKEIQSYSTNMLDYSKFNINSCVCHLIWTSFTKNHRLKHWKLEKNPLNWNKSVRKMNTFRNKTFTIITDFAKHELPLSCRIVVDSFKLNIFFYKWKHLYSGTLLHLENKNVSIAVCWNWIFFLGIKRLSAEFTKYARIATTLWKLKETLG